MHVDTEAGATISAGIGEMLEAIPCETTRNEIEANAGCADDLNRASEVLLAVFIVAEECRPASHVDGYFPSELLSARQDTTVSRVCD